MAYRVNGDEIFRDESSSYDYDPVTDRWIESGPAQRKTSSYSDDVLRTMEETERKQKEWEALERRAEERRQQNEYDRNNERERYEREKERLKEKEKAVKREAYEKAKKRYQAKSPLYRLFHKNPAKLDWQNMQEWELNSLHQGRSR